MNWPRRPFLSYEKLLSKDKSVTVDDVLASEMIKIFNGLSLDIVRNTFKTKVKGKLSLKKIFSQNHF